MPAADARDWPHVAIIVAVLDEAATLDGKLRDLVSIEYPADRLQLIVVDGGSTDGTIERLTHPEPSGRPMTTILAARSSKAAQLNEALRLVSAPWVLVTDADARMPGDTLKRLVDAAEGDPRIGVVGTPVRPGGGHPLDGWHWRLSNGIRRAEARFGTAGLVAAPCYLFRRSLIDAFPADATADDVHAACAAAAAGARVAFVDADVREIRVSTSGAGWYRQKIRRTVGYLREVMRFLPVTGRMPGASRAVFLWRASALTLAPLLGLAGVVAAGLAYGPRPLAVLACVGIGAASIRALPRRGAVLVHAALIVALPLSAWIVALAALSVYGCGGDAGTLRGGAMDVIDTEPA